MNKHVTIILAMVLIFLINTISASAAITGRIEGTITDIKTGEPLPGANVFIQGTNLGAASDLKGKYFIPNVPAGTYTIVARYIGYETKEMTNIRVQANQTFELDFKLAYQVLKGETVTVTAQAEGQLAAINQQLTAREIKNVISEAKIQELPDVNAAEAIGRLPGVSLRRSRGEASQVVVRGLTDANVPINVNGMRIPATNDSGSVGLAGISTEMLAGIEITKAIMPDQDADATGSTINFKLRSAQKGFKTRILLQPGYNAQQESYRMTKGSIDLSNRFFNNNLGAMANVTLDFKDRGTNQFGADYGSSADYIPGKPSGIELNSVSSRDRNTLRDRYGASLVLDYKLSYGELVFSNFLSRLKSHNDDYINKYSLNDQTASFNANFSDVATDIFTTGLTGEFNLLGTKLDGQFYSSRTKVDNPDKFFLNSTVFRAFGSNIKKNTRITASPEDIPHLAVLPGLDSIKVASSGTETSLREGTESAVQLNWEIPFNISKKINGYFKIGSKFRFLSRESKNTRNSATWVSQGTRIQNPNRVLLEDHPEVGWTTYEAVIALKHFVTDTEPKDFLDDYQFYYPLDRDFIKQTIEWCRESEKRNPSEPVLLGRLKEEAENYTNNELLSAGYIMAGINLGPRITFTPGIRFEQENIEFTSYYFDAGQGAAYPKMAQANAWYDTTISRTTQHWFPMVHLKYQVTDWFDVRLARTETITRPNYNHYNPRIQVNSGGGTISKGDINLKSILSTNYDCYLSFYNNWLGLFTVGGFYKEIENQIYSDKRPIDEREGSLYDRFPDFHVTIPTNNKHKGEVYGFEFDLQTHFWYLPGFLKGLTLGANYTAITSETRFDWFYDILEYDPTNPFAPPTVVEIDTSRIGRVVHQPRYLGNIILGYDIGNFSFRASVNFQDNTITNFNRRVPELDGFTKDWSRWNISMRQKLGKGFQLLVNLNNLSDTPEASYLPGRYGHLDYERRYGWSGDFGIRYEF